ncbi:MAG: serine/threonine protein kinase [Blastopirellula sp.]|nr:MAG: serine/threonine protein kinase [Blastopirellula sp.]
MYFNYSFSIVIFSLFLSLLNNASSQAEDWSRFRGPNGSGVSLESTDVPTSWSPSENLRWKTQLPGSGVSSPIVVGDRVFVTCYSGYGLNRENPGEIKNLKRHLVCIDRKSGKKRWGKIVDVTLPEDPYSGIGVTAHGYASHTPVSDGQHVFVFFGKSGVIAYDMDGNQLWQKSVGTESDPRKWGSSSSPILQGNKLIITAAAESQSIVALDKASGDELWRQEATSLDNSWSTPILVTTKAGRIELVLNVAGEVWGLNPETGKLIWYCSTSDADQAQSSAVVDSQRVVYTISGRGGASAAIKVGGKGDVSDTHLAWTGRETSRFGSPILHKGKLYLVASGVVSSIDVKSGERSSQIRLESESEGEESSGGGRSRGGRGGFGSLDYASPVISGENLFYLKSTGEMFVFKISDKLEQIAVNKVSDETESFGGTPAISNNQLFIRSNKHLYCVGTE